MIVPFGRNTVTVVECMETRDSNGKSRVSYQLNILYGCSWNASESLKTGDKEHDKTPRITCRIPADGQRCPCVGDVLILGVISTVPTTAKELQDLIDKHRKSGAFRATYVRNNAMVGYPLSHFRVEGE